MLRTCSLILAALAASTLDWSGTAHAAPASAEPTWAPASSAAVHPGVQTVTDGGQCTSNFVFFDGSNNVYLGQAAHCSGTDGNTATDGCTSGSLPRSTGAVRRTPHLPPPNSG